MTSIFSVKRMKISNYLHNRISKLEKDNDLPEFTNFYITGFEDGILEVGESLPRDSETILIEFNWETSFPDSVKENSIKIENLYNEQVIGNNLPNNGIYGVEFQEKFNFAEPSSLKFKISGVRVNDDPFEKELELQWVDKIFWGISPHKDITKNQVTTFTGHRLLESNSRKQNVTLDFLEAVYQYKVIVVPKRYQIKSVIDKETGLGFVFDEPFELNLKNEYDVYIPYLVYCSTYPVTSAVDLNCELGE